MRGERSIGIIVLVLIALWLLFRKAFSASVSTTINGKPVASTPDNQTLNVGNVGLFTPVPNSCSSCSSTPSMTPPNVISGGAVDMAAVTPYPFSPQSTLDNAGLSANDLATITDLSYHGTVA